MAVRRALMYRSHTRLARAAFTVVAAAFVLAASAGSWVDAGATRVVRFHPVSPMFSKQDLLEQADAVVIARYVGNERLRWNSRDGQEWKGSSLGRPAYIYRDDGFAVTRVASGVAPDWISVRTVGGRIGDVQMIYEGQPSWDGSQDYLLFLRQEDTPLDSGSERAWTLLWMEQGVFEPNARGGWTNASTGLEFLPDELAHTR